MSPNESTSWAEAEGSEERSSPDGAAPRDDKAGRAAIACMYCRGRRTRCSGDRPACQACVRDRITCLWPAGRKRKRTKREIELARMDELEKIIAEGAAPDPNLSIAGPSNQADSSDSTKRSPNDALHLPFQWDATHAPLHDLPMTDQDIFSALRTETGYLQGVPDEDENLELYYYRFGGSTAIQPGIHRVSLRLQRRRADDTPNSAPPLPDTPDLSRETIDPASSMSMLGLFDDSDMPYNHTWEPLFDIFLRNMCQHFPSISKRRMTERMQSGTMSRFLAITMCALAARYTIAATNAPIRACTPFITKAQELVLPLIHLPTTETLTGLLMLAWAYHGQSSESGMGQYHGMAVRMAMDIGINEISDIYDSPAHLVRTRLLWWTLFINDRIIAFGLGRQASIPDDVIEIPLPDDKDFFPDPSRDTEVETAQEPVEPIPFVHLTRLIVICGGISDLLNGRRGKSRTLASASSEPLSARLNELQLRLVKFLSELPPSLVWSSANFKHHDARGHGSTFLTLHLWARGVLALVYNPELLRAPSGAETPMTASMQRDVSLSLTSARQICECIAHAELVAPITCMTSPLILQPLFVAGMSFIHEMRPLLSTAPSNPADAFLLASTRSNLSVIMDCMSRLQRYWAGSSQALSVLEKRGGTTSGPKTTAFIAMPDKGQLKRFSADRNHPNHIAPPTETSMQEYLAKESQSQLEKENGSPLWLADLLATYTVQNMAFAPVDDPLDPLLAAFMGDGQVPQ